MALPEPTHEEDPRNKQHGMTVTDFLSHGDAEDAVLAGIMDSGKVPPPELTSSDFSTGQRRAVFTAITTLVQRGELVDFITLTAQLEATGQLVAIGGPGELIRLSQVPHTVDGFDSHVAIVRRQAAARMIHAASDKIQEHLAAHAGDPKTALEYLQRITAAAEVKLAPATTDAKRVWTVRETLAHEPRQLPWLVDGLIPAAGLHILASRPKCGKSFMMLQLVLARISGGEFLGRMVTQGTVRYMALEDGPDRITKRTRQQRWPECVEDSLKDASVFQYDADHADVVQLLSSDDPPGVIIVDTLTRLIGGRVDWNDLAEVTGALGPIQRLAIERGVACILVDHTKKPSRDSGDPLDQVIGSTGKTGCADTILALDRQDFGVKKGVLHCTGRDTPQGEVYLDWDEMLCQWQLGGDGTGSKPLPKHADTILEAVRHQPGHISAIAASTGLSKNTVSRTLGALYDAGILEINMAGQYHLAEDEKPRLRSI